MLVWKGKGSHEDDETRVRARCGFRRGSRSALSARERWKYKVGGKEIEVCDNEADDMIAVARLSSSRTPEWNDRLEETAPCAIRVGGM